MKHITFILMLILSVSCQRSPSYIDANYTIFEDVDSLKGELVVLPASIIGVIDLDIVDSLLLFTSPKADYYYSVYDLNQNRVIGRFVGTGRAGNEVISPSGITAIKRDSDIIIHSYDYGRSKLFKFNLTKSIQNGTTIAKVDDFTCQNPLTTHNYAISDDKYLSRCLSKEGSIFMEISDQNRNVIQSVRVLDADYKYDSFLASATNFVFDNKIVSAYMFLDFITILDLENPLDHQNFSTSSEVFSLEYTTGIPMKNIKECYLDVKATDRYIYALYVGAKRQEWAELPSVNAEIHIFDWDGNPIKNIKVDSKITNICVDDSNQTIYGLNNNTEELFRYHLSL